MTARTHRTAAAVALALLVGLAGCSTPATGGPSTAPTAEGGPTSGSASTPGGADVDGGSGETPGSSSTAPADEAPAPAPSAPAVATRTADPVAVGEDAPFEGGLVARVTAVDEIDVDARGPGDVDGPGRLVRLRLDNGSDVAVDLDGVTVTATTVDGAAAPSVSGSPTEPVGGELAPGASAEGAYAFTAPAGAALRVEVVQNEQPDVVVVEQ